MIRWFWRIYLPLAAAVFLAMSSMALGPAIQARFFPVRIHNENRTPVRTDAQVCWTWSSDKIRDAFSDNVDVSLDLLDAEGRTRNTFVPYLYNVRTGLPWQSGNSLALGHSEIPYCIDLPRIVKPEDRLRIRFTIIYHGLLNLWTLPMSTPDIVDPPTAR